MPDYELDQDAPINFPRDGAPSFSAFVSWGFQALLLAMCAWGVSELSSLSKSVQELNVKMAVVVERDFTRGEEIRELKERVSHLEERKSH